MAAQEETQQGRKRQSGGGIIAMPVGNDVIGVTKTINKHQEKEPLVEK